MPRTCWLKILGCIAITLLSAIACRGAGTGSLPEADALLTSPTLDMSQAERALTLYTGLLSSGGAPRPVVLAQLSRTWFVMGDLSPKKYSDGFFRKGKIYAEMLIKEDPNRTEGHYWLAMNLCGQAEAGGLMTGRKLLPQIIEELERALVLDETYDQAGAHRVLGRIYFEAPGWPMSVGDLKKSLEHLQAAVRLAPDNSTNHLYLAQTLYRLNYPSLARQQLELVLTSRQHAVKTQDLEEDKQEARRLLSDMKSDKPL
jgi:tetratricopeptide (TPR) repeat protein